MVAELLSIIRATNPTRTVIIAPKKLEELRLPPGDRNIVVTLHHYWPFRFTHQGARWTKIKELRGVAWGSPADRQRIRDWFDRVRAWAHANQRPILIGEFGVYDRSGIPVHMRADYTATVACEAERRGFGWAYWQFDGDFIAWDMKRDRWVHAIREALIPRRGRPPDC